MALNDNKHLEMQCNVMPLAAKSRIIEMVNGVWRNEAIMSVIIHLLATAAANC